MEYSVGSLGSLISGIKAGGQKVVQKEFKLPEFETIPVPEKPKKAKPVESVETKDKTSPSLQKPLEALSKKKLKRKELRKLQNQAKLEKSVESGKANESNNTPLQKPVEEPTKKKLKRKELRKLAENQGKLETSVEKVKANESEENNPPKKLKKKQLRKLAKIEAEAQKPQEVLPQKKLKRKELRKLAENQSKLENPTEEKQESQDEVQNDKRNDKNSKLEHIKTDTVMNFETEKSQINSTYDLPNGSLKRYHVDDENEEPDAKKTKSDIPLNNAQKRIKGKETKLKYQEKKAWVDEDNDRTVFIGNVDVNVSKKTLTGLFSKYGKIENIRFRGAPVADVRTPKKVAIIKKEYHDKRETLIAFVKYDKRESALKAIELNGSLLNDKHLRVDMCDAEKSPEKANAIFIGNISFTTEEEKLWETFAPCGKIVSVRLIRDKVTNIGKGFGYINFESADSVHLALNMGEVQIDNRTLRISQCGNKSEKKREKKAIRAERRTNNFGNDTKQRVKKENMDYQGFKQDKKSKKKRMDRGMLAKKRLVNKVAPRSKE
ncbi:PREDICTED: RNA-binding protein 34 [Nicrophorus vespilloides]|uniref:RNA-binding protein 34 n=1 Tax=Nicrophorus vespilloides TaxID=110193 RepID=A0ABM1M9Y7_NICVS|nr:PREDICTED: RNA-binding protein 34 [Nicrophorus vespilloides]